MARRNNIRAKAKSGLGALPKKGIRDRKIGGGFMPQPRPRPMPMPINRPPQMIQPMPINRPMPMPISGRPPAPILGGNDFLPNPGFGVAPVGTPQPNFDLEALRGIPNQTNFPMPGGQMLPMLPNENQIPFTPPGMEGIQEAINQQIPFQNLNPGLMPQGSENVFDSFMEDPIMSPGGNPNFNERGPAFDPRQMPISIGRIDEGRPPAPILGGNDFLPNTGDLTSIQQPLPNDPRNQLAGGINLDDFRNTLGQGVGNNPDKKPIPSMGNENPVPFIGDGLTPRGGGFVPNPREGIMPIATDIPKLTDEMKASLRPGPAGMAPFMPRVIDDGRQLPPGVGPQPIPPATIDNPIQQLQPINSQPGSGIKQPMPVNDGPGSMGRPVAPILGGSDFLPKPGFIGRPDRQPPSIGGPGGGRPGLEELGLTGGGENIPEYDYSNYLDFYDRPRPPSIGGPGFGKPGFDREFVQGGSNIIPGIGKPTMPRFDREFDPSRLLGPGDSGYIDTSRLLPEPPGGLTPAPVVTPAPVIEPAPVTPPQSTTVAGNDPAVTGGTPTTGATSPVTPPAATPPAATPPATTATDPVASQNPFVSNLVRNETGMDAITKQLLFGLDGQGGFIPGAMQASENTFFNADGTPRVVEENVAGMTQDQKYAQELARQSVGMQDPYLQQAQDAYGAGIDVLGQGLASAQQRGEQALGATAAGVAEEQALRDQGLASTLKGLGQGSRLATDATSGLAGQLGDVEGIQRRATQQFQEQAGGAGADATGATDRFGNRLGESEQMLRGTTGGYNQSMTDQFYNPYEDAVVDQVSKDIFKQYDKGDIAARASDIARGGESAYGSRARLGAGERAEAMGRGLAEAIGGIRSRGFQQAQQAGLGEFARQKQAERTAASGLSGLAGQRLGAQQQLGGTLRGISGDQLSAQQNLASGLGALAGQRYQAGTNLGSTLAGYGSQAGSALGGAGQAALGSAGQLAGAYGTMGGLEGQIGQQAQQAMFGLGSNMQGLGAQAQGATQQDIAQMYGLGQGQQQLNQQRLDAMRRNALTAQQAPLAQYQSLMPFMNMVPQGQFNTQTTFAPRPSALQAGLGVGLSSLGAMGQFMNQGNK